MNFAYLNLNGSQVKDSSILAKLMLYRGDIGVDVETPTLEDRTPLGCGFAISKTEAFYFAMDSPYFPWFKLKDPNIRIVMHNSQFDMPILENYGKLDITNVVDSTIAAQLLGLPPRLGELCLYLFDRPIRNIEELIGPKGPNQLRMDQVDPNKVAERGMRDSIDTLEAWTELEMGVPEKALDLEVRVAPILMDIERRGIQIDTKAVHAHRQRLEKDFNYYKLICQGMGFSPGSGNELATKLESDGYKVLYKRGKDGKATATAEQGHPKHVLC